MVIVIVLELFMLGYTVANSEMYGDLIWRYRSFYLFLLAVAVIYIIVNMYVKKDMEHRVKVMTIANPLCAILFYAWSLAVTYSDFTVIGVVDLTVFMTFSLVVSLGFYMSPWKYGAIVGVADALLVYIILSPPGSIGLIINGSIFFIFQIVLGVNYLRMRLNIAERTVSEMENALIDVLTGCSNRRAYETEIQAIQAGKLPRDLAYIVVDLDGLKEVNDSHGHEAGDRLISGAAQCAEQSFGAKGRVFRVGGDEFVVLVHADQQELADAFTAYDAKVESWAKENELPLSTSYGYACAAELSGNPSVVDLAQMADERMYQAKARYYQMSGIERRRYRLDASGAGQ